LSFFFIALKYLRSNNWPQLNCISHPITGSTVIETVRSVKIFLNVNI
jgi:hypothetical protein